MKKTFKQYLALVENDNLIRENATAGASSAASVATSVATGGLGVGFDPNGDFGVYSKPKKRADSKVPVIRRS
jgi:hypothetical protein